MATREATRSSLFADANGCLWYSPNCSRDVQAPPTTLRYDKCTSIDEFKSPHWWTEDFAWASMVPLRPSFEGALLDRLLNLAIQKTGTDVVRYGMETNVMERWLRLESAFHRFVEELRLWSGSHSFPPVKPISYGYDRQHKKERWAICQAAMARDAFLAWGAYISFLIFSASWRDEEWVTRFISLAGHRWISILNESQIGCFRPEAERVGTFILFRDQDSTKRHPLNNLQWFVDNAVPVWYPLRKEDYDMMWKNSNLRKWAPDPDKLQSLLGFLRLPSRPLPQVDPVTGQELGQTWQDFFEERTIRYKAVQELPWRRLMREKRELRKPLKGAKFFEWTKNNSGFWVRTLIPKCNEKSMLVVYSDPIYRRYDAHLHEWDFGYIFDPDYKDPISENDEDDLDFPQIDPEACVPFQSGSNEYENTEQSAQNSYDDEEGEIPDNEDALVQILSQRYGFVLSVLVNEISSKDWSDCLRSCGHPIQTAQNTHSSAIVSFVTSFSSKPYERSVAPFLYDLHPACPSALRHRPLNLGVSQLDDGYRIKCPPPPPSLKVNWSLLLLTPLDVVQCVRLGLDTSYEVGNELLERGIPFQTIVRVTGSVDRNKFIPPHKFSLAYPPLRRKGSTFDVEDYLNYESYRRSILSLPHARAALLQGGIVWRLAKETLPFDRALRGPSFFAIEGGIGKSWRDSHEGVFYDDALTESELDLICGTYHCYDFDKDPEMRRPTCASWWPTSLSWNSGSAGRNVGYWTQSNELWFQDRLRKILSGQAQPLSATEWRRNLKGYTSAREFDKNAGYEAQMFVESILQRA